MRVLVCGGRDYDDDARVNRTLVELHNDRRITAIIHGGATGADTYAARWGAWYGVDVLKFAARWSTEGRGAGPKRNQRMLDVGKPDLVVAFPGGRGTADMVRRARAAGVRVIEVKP